MQPGLPGMHWIVCSVAEVLIAAADGMRFMSGCSVREGSSPVREDSECER